MRIFWKRVTMARPLVPDIATLVSASTVGPMDALTGEEPLDR